MAENLFEGSRKPGLQKAKLGSGLGAMFQVPLGWRCSPAAPMWAPLSLSLVEHYRAAKHSAQAA